MAKRKRKASLADETKGRVGSLVLIISAICLVLAVMFFLPNNGSVMGMDVGRNSDIWGWIVMLFSLFLAVTGLSVAVTMSKR